MKTVGKTIRPRLPEEAREKIRKGGRHGDRKSDYRRVPKHRNKEE